MLTLRQEEEVATLRQKKKEVRPPNDKDLRAHAQTRRVSTHMHAPSAVAAAAPPRHACTAML